MEPAATVVALVRSAHPGPALAVTVLAVALAVSADLSGGRVALVAGAVAAGQLSVGWSNDLIDRHRDRQVGRSDKPLATGALSATLTARACAIAVAATVVLSLLCGLVAGVVHLGCVAVAWAYNLGLKSTPFSWLPYALAFGGLPVFVELADPGAGPPPLWMPVSAALLGVGAHLVNALPDLADDEATGVRGLPHRLGPRRTRWLAVAVLVLASVVIVLGSAAVPVWLVVVVLTAVAGLGVVALVADGRTPFQAAIGIALADAVMLVAGR
ncbi:UbiA family prenyltransferase [Nocardioides conyzicola]|uniref:UbiA family prenyltransferase n=1 Tax=Nocardioides conyzicola TaxID=1651781 RepID=A0ABP8WRG0_9ACTN